MPQPFGKAVLTNAGAGLLLRAQAGDARIEFTRIAVGDGSYAEEEKTMHALQQSEALKSEKNSYPVSNKEIHSEHCVKITAVVTNQEPGTGRTLVDAGYFMNEMGLFAKEHGGDGSTEILYSVVVAAGENGDFMPPYNGYCPVQIIQDYYVTVSNSAEVTIQTSGAFVLAQDFEAFKRRADESIKRIEARLQQVISLLCSYHYDGSTRKIASLMPHKYENGILEFPEGAAHMEGSTLVLDGINGMDGLQGILGGTVPAGAGSMQGGSGKEDE